ncbi:methyltransferase domain-containing protein [Ruegeria sp.]|uniref:class I SAM-dependent methyltransferase n=1 Tax=Ruegeria sp. TaxID=1879320 RepID=UPI0023089404|nr:methyltransferase domain-containing protein [Ruegeria sp.]MDA7964053.1 class I SAM-dependent methyltransferase [Ruegeria sp.]
MDADKLYKSLHKGHIRQEEARVHSAKRIHGLCERFLDVKSVVDVGCGVGFLLAEFESRDRDICGVEGDWLEDTAIRFSGDALVRADLEQPFSLDRKFDLCVSTEVAEHLEPARAESFVADLTQLADAVVFSAAIAGQGGTGHKNEQWQDYWVKLFDKQGYAFFDALRPNLWTDPLVMDWFKQNLMVFVKRDAPVNSDLSDYASTAEAARMIVPKYHDKIVRKSTRQLRRLRKEKS